MKSKTNMQKSRIEKDLNEENEKLLARQEHKQEAAIIKLK